MPGGGDLLGKLAQEAGAVENAGQLVVVDGMAQVPPGLLELGALAQIEHHRHAKGHDHQQQHLAEQRAELGEEIGPALGSRR